MTNAILKFSKVRDVKSPVRGTPKSAGIDFFIPNDFEPTFVYAGYDCLIPSGIVASIPEGYMLMGADKSGVSTSRQACINANRTPKPDAYECPTIIGAKIVDEDYQGEIHIHIINSGLHPIRINPGQKISQFILVPVNYCALEEVEPVDDLFDSVSERGAGALGSTDKEEE